MTCKVSIEADYYAYSVHNDAWEAERLELSLRWLETIPRRIPDLYCSRTWLVDAKSNKIDLYLLFFEPPSFTNVRQMGLIPHLLHFKRSGIYRQTLFGNLGPMVAVIFGKI